MKLRIGQFYGAALHSRTVPGFVLSEVCYGPGTVLPKHSHEQAYFSFLWRGGYQEECGRRLRHCEQGTAVFHPEGEVQADRFSGSGGHLLNLEINPSPLVRAKDPAFLLADATYFGGGPVVELGLKICAAMSARDPVWTLSIAMLTSTGSNPVTQWNVPASPQPVYFGRVFSLSSTRFNSSSFCPASPSLPSAVRR